MVETSHVQNDPKEILEAALKEQIAAGCPGTIIEIDSPRLGFNFSSAQGFYSRHDLQPLRVDHTFRAASVAKLVTAAVAVLLAADHRWNLDDPVTNHLPSLLVTKLSRLKGLNTVNELTVQRLLNHSSGLPDYFFNEKFRTQTRKYPEHLWQPEELVDAAVESGNILFKPGSDFSYGDTAYVVMGIAIETLLNCSLADAYRSLIFEPLSMEATYLEYREAPRRGDLSHHYDGDEDLRDENLSFDWGGGGLATTVRDLTAFLRGLFGGSLFSPRWVAEMTNWQDETRWRPHSSARYIRYGLGLGTNVAYGSEIIGATGVWGAFAYYWPAGDATITGTLNLVGADRPALMDLVIRALKQIR